MTSITPTINMKPNAISANSNPSDNPLTRCGARPDRNSTYTSYVGVAS
jgi:hypothetical protein